MTQRHYDRDSVQYLHEDELAALFAAIGNHARDRALFEVALHRGLRVSEVGKLQLEHLRLEDRMLYVTRLKSGISGEYRLTNREVRALQAWVAERGTRPGPLFPSKRWLPLSRSRLDEMMRRYATAAGLPAHKRHFHCLRHTAGTKLGELSGDPAEVMDHLGHRCISSTMVYLKVRNKRRSELGDRLADKW